ncbi:MAG: DUF5717 family protein [Lachnospiraceae bacterium]|nr:DUF5717 family protein [Lachnospiraceae bacterium]
MSLALSIKRIEETCLPRSLAMGSFVINASECESIAFMLRASHRCIKLDRTDYSGELPEGGISIVYEIDSHGFDPGMVFKGFISVVSDQGEDRIPVTLSIVREEIMSSKGPLRNLFHFTNLAKEDFNEAVELFYTENARRIFEGGDRETFFKYRAFSECEKKGRKYEGLEEFLIETGKKNPVLLSFAEQSVMRRNPEEDVYVTVTVRKSGWGYPGFTLKATDDFISLEKNEYTLEDFEGNFAEISFYIKYDRLHSGHNFGRIELSSLHSEALMPVFVDMSEGNPTDRERMRSRKTATVRLMNEYINYRIGNTSPEEWISNSNKILERLLVIDRNDPVSRLLQAHLLLSSGRTKDADIVLQAAEHGLDEDESPYELLSYYEYLRAYCDQDDRETDRACKKVWDYYQRSDESWRILWVLIYLDDRLKMSPERERALLEEQVSRGMRSPLMYLEAYSILSRDPTLIRALNEFEINVLVFAVRHSLMKREIADQVANLTQRMRGYDPRIIRIMAAYYDEFQDDDMLRSICSYLIRNEITDNRFFRFFEKAVERDLGVTNLYDFYLYTMKLGSTKLLPKNVLMYYGFRNDLPPQFRAYVYANMIVNEDEAGIILQKSMDDLKRFAASEVLQGNMDENLAIIVDYIGYFMDADDPSLDTGALKSALVKNAFMRLVLLNDPKISTVTVTEDAFYGERSAPVKDGRAYLNIYDNDFEIFFEDDDGRRYGSRFVTYDEIKLMRPYDLIEGCGFTSIDDPGLWVALSEKGRSYISVDSGNVSYVSRILDSDLFYPRFKEGLLTELMRFYYDNDMPDELNALLLKTDAADLTMEERNEYVRFCSMRGNDDESYRIIREYGSYGMEPRILMRIATRVIQESETINEALGLINPIISDQPLENNVDPVLLEIASATFRGNKYNEEILGYLSRYYEGTTRELKDIWSACRDFEAEVSVIEGRILEQMLATGAYIGERDEIFFDYLKGDPSKRIISLYFKKAAEDSFLHDAMLDDRLYIGLLDFAIDGEINDIEALCLIRFYEGRRDMRTDRILYPYLRSLAERDIIFDFFLSYKDLIPSLELFSEDMFIEHKSDPGLKVTLNYCLETSPVENPSFKSEDMREVCPGVYQARGAIFPGECLQYYITVEGAGPARSDIERSEDNLKNGSGRYEILQDALLSLNMQDKDSFIELVEDYMIKDKIAREVIWAES